MFELSKWKFLKISCLTYDLLHKLKIYHKVCLLREKQWHLAIRPWDLFLILFLTECWIAASYKDLFSCSSFITVWIELFLKIVHNILSSQDLFLLIQLYQKGFFTVSSFCIFISWSQPCLQFPQSFLVFKHKAGWRVFCFLWAIKNALTKNDLLWTSLEASNLICGLVMAFPECTERWCYKME